jgi:hypothetical protein
VPRSRMLELYLLSSTLLHGMILNWLNAMTNFSPFY